jgi:hypothetical protein
LVHWGVNRHTVDKSWGLSVIIPYFFLFNCHIFPFVNFFREMMVRERDSYHCFCYKV